MGRVIIKFNDDTYVNAEADEFHEDGEYVKAYKKNELVVMCKTSELKLAYFTEKKN